jgi:hypothetical protein
MLQQPHDDGSTVENPNPSTMPENDSTGATSSWNQNHSPKEISQIALITPPFLEIALKQLLELRIRLFHQLDHRLSPGPPTVHPMVVPIPILFPWSRSVNGSWTTND